MKRLAILICVCSFSVIYSQGFDCNASMYVVVYSESLGQSNLFEIKEENQTFEFNEIPLSEDRHLTALVYNVLDKHLLALDADSYELVRIDKTGKIVSLGVPDNIDMTMQYRAASFSPDGSAMIILAYDSNQEKNTRIYTINLARTDLYAGFLGATGPPNIDVVDFATDPITGIVYGFDSHENKLIQLGIGGEITTLFYPDTGENFIDAVLFNQDGELFGFSPVNGLFAMDKGTGQVNYLTKGPGGSTADGCSCPFTYSFTKTITPKQIIPCEPFEVQYNFVNKLGIGQAWIELRDTFPNGFEILDIEGDAVSAHNIIPGTPKNILALENLIYLMGENQITLTVKPEDGFVGQFNSNARQLDFPAAFNVIQYSDDPATLELNDATIGEILVSGEIDFNNSLDYSCDGKSATIHSPFEATEYLWSDNSTEPSILVNEIGWYSLLASSDCFTFYDSIFIDDFLVEKEVDLGNGQQIMLGDSVLLLPAFNRESIPGQIKWMENGTAISCADCKELWVSPNTSTRYSIEVIDDSGCILSDHIDIEVDQQKNVYVPNAFSPNGDGVNETLFISASVPGTVLAFEVYDRWGNLVYSRNNYLISDTDIFWDGSFNGETLGIGNYIWRAELDFIDGYKQSYSGQVMIMSN